MERVKGRPQNIEGRLDKEIRVYDFLDSLGIEYERIDHEPAMTIEACEEIDRVLEAVICKNLFLCNRQETDFYLLMIPGDKKFKTKDISAQIGSSRLSFGKPEYMEQFLDITPGSVSVLGLMNDKDYAWPSRRRALATGVKRCCATSRFSPAARSSARSLALS